jgi:hypothetical protein
MLFCRTDSSGQVLRVALADGSIVRASGRRRFTLALAREVPDLHVDLGQVHGAAPPGEAEARVSGSAFGARIQLAGCDVAVAAERRSLARPKARRR